MMWSSVIVLALALLPATLAFPRFVPNIPNLGVVGGTPSLVPSPSGVAGVVCQSIGHVASCDGAPSGDGNVFGMAFLAGGSSWAAVCSMDSDGDGLTNGMELGDPDCTFPAGQTPARTTALSHPGFACSTTANPFCLPSVTTAAPMKAATTAPAVSMTTSNNTATDDVTTANAVMTTGGQSALAAIPSMVLLALILAAMLLH
ncbi:temptin-like isoform X1 [Sycon ciliatum]|uniref:temptin-like isoform X1 n=1 Tax=Sycon ciliatum TaxID=27933 RepID=UPI0031F6E0B5